MDRSVFESCEEDADELFNHLEELLRGKDAMGKKGRRLAQARAAREVLERQRSVLGQQKELEAIDADLAAIAIERSEALAREDEEQEKSCRLRLLQLENARAIRAGAKTTRSENSTLLWHSMALRILRKPATEIFPKMSLSPLRQRSKNISVILP